MTIIKKLKQAEYVAEMEMLYQKKLTANRSFLLGAKFYTALDALNFSEGLHNGKRKDGSPEFIHQLTGAQFMFHLLDTMVYPEESLAAFYLHDAPEDKDVLHSYIKNRFGEIIAKPVFLMDKNRFGSAVIPPEEYYGELSECIVGSLCKPVDRSHNLGTMWIPFSLAKKKKYVLETEEYVLPMLKQAFYNFPRQASFYGVMRHALKIQLQPLREALKMN